MRVYNCDWIGWVKLARGFKVKTSGSEQLYAMAPEQERACLHFFIAALHLLFVPSIFFAKNSLEIIAIDVVASMLATFLFFLTRPLDETYR